MLIFLPILISGMNSSCFGGSSCNARIGAIAGTGPDGGDVLGGWGGPLVCNPPAVAEGLDSPEASAVGTDSVVAFNAVISAVVKALLFFDKSRSNSLSRNSAEESAARACTSPILTTP